jgi:formate hydrogenlyase subunit 3/multisubunit Na+/H+ antiporter MnhD subunit
MGVTTGPLLVLLVPLLAGGAAYVLRRWRAVPTLLASGIALLMGLVLLLLPSGQSLEVGGQEILLEQPVTVLGRALVLESADRLAIGFLFLSGAGLFLLAWRFDQGALFAPIGLGLLSLLAGVLLVRPLIYAALFLQIGAALSIFPLHAEAETSARAGMVYLTFYTLALPGLLVSHWLLELYVVSPDQVDLLQTATGLIAFSFALMLGLFPFHAWVPAAGRDGAPLMAAFLYTTTAGAVWFLLLDYLQTYPWLVEHARWSTVLPLIGTVTAVVGGGLGASRGSPGKLIGYATMVDTGMMVVALGQGARAGLGVAVGLLFARALGAALMSAGLGGVRERSDGAIDPPQGAGRRAPWSTLAILVGGLSLTGFPPTAGFAARWALLSAVFAASPATGILLLLASFGTLVGLLRLLAGLLRRPRELLPVSGAAPPQEEGEGSPPTREPVANTALFLVFVVANLVLGLFPQWIAGVADRLAAHFTFFGP